MSDEKWLNTRDCAKAIGCTPNYIYILHKKGKLRRIADPDFKDHGQPHYLFSLEDAKAAAAGTPKEYEHKPEKKKGSRRNKKRITGDAAEALLKSAGMTTPKDVERPARMPRKRADVAPSQPAATGFGAKLRWLAQGLDSGVLTEDDVRTLIKT